MTDVPDPAIAKQRERAHLLAARRARTSEDLASARRAVAAGVLARAATRGWRCVAAYEPLRTEPGSVELLAGLVGVGVRVLVPVTLADRDLDWRRWDGHADGPLLGPEAIGGADAVLVPALAVDATGVRLGRGGGSYDRALRRCRPGAELLALLFEGETVRSLPAQVWDVPMTAVLDPSGWSAVGHDV